MIYEDTLLQAELSNPGAAEGHITITTKKPTKHLADLSNEEVIHLFYLASFSATAVFEGLGAQGTNILINEGDAIETHILPRKADDGIDLFWNPQKGNPAELSNTASKVRDALWYVGKEENKVPAVVEAPSTQTTEETKEPQDNYKLKHLERSP